MESRHHFPESKIHLFSNVLYNQKYFLKCTNKSLYISRDKCKVVAASNTKVGKTHINYSPPEKLRHHFHIWVSNFLKNSLQNVMQPENTF